MRIRMDSRKLEKIPGGDIQTLLRGVSHLDPVTKWQFVANKLQGEVYMLRHRLAVTEKALVTSMKGMTLKPTNRINHPEKYRKKTNVN